MIKLYRFDGLIKLFYGKQIHGHFSGRNSDRTIIPVIYLYTHHLRMIFQIIISFSGAFLDRYVKISK